MQEVKLEEDSGRILLVKKLKEHFRKEIFVLTYNRFIEEGIKEGDEQYFMFFIEQVIKKRNIRDCVLIINGFGGNLKTALICSNLFRQNLNYYSCFVPSVIGSSLCYFALQSNNLLIGEQSIITQIDPLIEHDGEQLRAIKNLSHIDGDIRAKSHKAINYNIEIIKDTLKKGRLLNKKCFSGKNEIISSELSKIVKTFMGKDSHDSVLKIDELKKLSINFRIEDQGVVVLAKDLVKSCVEELLEMDDFNRFVIQTDSGGYFFK